MEAAGKAPYFSNTLFVFVGDHGIRGNAGSLLPKAFTSKGLTCEHVPLLFYWPANLKAKRVNEVCSQVDILPSIAAIAKVPFRNNTFGRNLFETQQPVTDSSSGKQNYAFIIDHDLKTIGLVSDRYYFLEDIKTGKKELVSVINNDEIPASAETDSIKSTMGILTEAWYETAKYLLLHNKKKN